MEGTTTNWSSWIFGAIILVFLFFFVFNDDKDTRNCEVERQMIVQTATTQDLVNQNGAQTRQAITEDGQRTREKIDFYAYEDLKDKLACERASNAELKSMLYSNEKFCNLEKQIDTIACQLPVRPPYYARGYVPTGECIPSSCSVA